MEKIMKQSNGSIISSTLFDDNEIEVSEILLELPELIAESDYRNRQISVNWAVTKRRSAASSLRSPSPPPKMSSPAIIVKILGEDGKKRTFRKSETVSTSPATPLSFTPSESEEKKKKNKNPIKLSRKKRMKEVWLRVVAEETQLNGLLKKELETVKFHFLKLKALNLELKARIAAAEESRGEKVVLCMETNKSMNLKSESVQLIVKPTMKLEDMENHPQPLIINNQTARKPAGEDLRYYMWGPHGNTNNNIPDLNVSLEDGNNNQQFDYRCVLRNSTADYNRAKATEARKKRRQIYKAKNSTAASDNIYRPRPGLK